MRLIDADALDFALVDEYITDESPTDALTGKGRAIFNAAIDIARCRAADADTVNVMPVVHSRWHEDSVPFCNVCKECGAVVDRHCVKANGSLKHCPNCGAKMEGEQHGD